MSIYTDTNMQTPHLRQLRFWQYKGSQPEPVFHIAQSICSYTAQYCVNRIKQLSSTTSMLRISQFGTQVNCIYTAQAAYRTTV